MPMISGGSGGAAVHALDSASHSGVLTDAQIPADITRDSEWNGIDFLTVSAQGALSAERLMTPGSASGIQPAVLRKTTAQTVNNSTTLVNLSEIVFTPAINTVWHVRYVLRVTTTAAADLRLGMSLPAGASLVGVIRSDGTSMESWTGGTQSVLCNGSGTEIVTVDAIVIMGATSGAIQLQFAQGTATAVDTTVEVDSIMIAERTN